MSAATHQREDREGRGDTESGASRVRFAPACHAGAERRGSEASTSADPDLPRKRHLRFWILLSLFIIGAIYVYTTDPMSPSSIPCVFHETTGFYCPGCGMTRAVHAALHGHLLAAVRFNPLMIFVLPVLLWRILADAWETKPRTPVRPVWLYLFFAAVLAFWIARNIPKYPFTLLAPPAS